MVRFLEKPGSYHRCRWSIWASLPKNKDRRWVGSRLAAQPIKTFQQRVRLTNPAAAALPRAYIHCTNPALVHFMPFVERAKAEGWRYRELPTARSPNVTAPELLADVLLELA